MKSPYFRVGPTAYGGRGCFATQFIPKNTLLLEAKLPVGSAVTRPFRKEVCTWCFDYQGGKTLKVRKNNKLYFCSEECLNNFDATDFDSSLTKALMALEDHFPKLEGDIEHDKVPKDSGEELLQIIAKHWQLIDEWDLKIQKTKPLKRLSQLPKLTKDDYAEARYVIGVLHSLYTNSVRPDALELALETSIFHTLESSELPKVHKYPYLLLSYANIFKFLRITCPDQFQKFITPQSVREIIGKNLTNAFGIWSPQTQEDEEREFFGFGVYPSASFFNHSCAYNIAKERKNRAFLFRANQDILPETELCISYGISGSESVELRQATLLEWFFQCACTKCKEDQRVKS